MVSRTSALACTAVLLAASSVSAQRGPGDSLTLLQKAVACQSPPRLAFEPTDAIRIVGSQDVVSRELFGSPEVLVLDAGANRELKVNAIYFTRRVYRTAETLHDKVPHTLQTSGWVRVVAVNNTMALVSPEHTCTDIRSGDFLEPFAAPVVQEGDALAPIVQSELDFDVWLKVLHGEIERDSVGTNEFATIEHGFDRDVKVGTRFAVYRDLQLTNNPLKRIGEAIAVWVGPSLTLVRVTSARDAIFSGDVMVPRKSDGVKVPPAPSPAEAGGRAKTSAESPVTRPYGCQSGGRVPPQSPQCAD